MAVLLIWIAVHRVGRKSQVNLRVSSMTDVDDANVCQKIVRNLLDYSGFASGLIFVNSKFVDEAVAALHDGYHEQSVTSNKSLQQRRTQYFNQIKMRCISRFLILVN